MRSSLLVLATAAVASAIKFGDWLQTNGLVSHYADFVKYDQDFISNIENQQDVTVFIPINRAWSKWQAEPNVSSNSFTYNVDTFTYMAVEGAYTVKDLETMTSLTSVLQNEKLKVKTEGIYPDLTVYILSGTGFTHNSTVGVVDQDFNIDNGHVQLVNSPFLLPTAIGKTANADKTQSAASARFGFMSLLTRAGIVGMFAMM